MPRLKDLCQKFRKEHVIAGGSFERLFETVLFLDVCRYKSSPAIQSHYNGNGHSGIVRAPGFLMLSVSCVGCFINGIRAVVRAPLCCDESNSSLITPRLCRTSIQTLAVNKVCPSRTGFGNVLAFSNR